MSRFANERTRAAAEGAKPDSGAETDDSVAANMLRAAGRTVSPQPESERAPGRWNHFGGDEAR